MGFSVEGLMDSNVLPSWPLTNSLLMKLQVVNVSNGSASWQSGMGAG